MRLTSSRRHDAGEITANDIRRFLEQMDDDPSVGARSINKRRTVLHGIFGLAVERARWVTTHWTKVAKRAEPESAEVITCTAAR
jgi:hypothetical protein